MSLVSSENKSIDYPESDDKPMGETDWHIDWTLRLRDMLKVRYRGQQVYVASDLLLYYHEGVPQDFVVPDGFVVLDCDPSRRRFFKTWEEQRIPNVVFEFTSKRKKGSGTDCAEHLEGRFGNRFLTPGSTRNLCGNWRIRILRLRSTWRVLVATIAGLPIGRRWDVCSNSTRRSGPFELSTA